MDPRRLTCSWWAPARPAASRRLVLARAGARVALLDKARFPRDKACGDFIGPRGLQVLADLGLPEPPGLDVGDMVVVGPTGRRVVLPCFDGATYPGRARAVPRIGVRRRPPGRRPRRRGPSGGGPGRPADRVGRRSGGLLPRRRGGSGRLRDRGRRGHQPGGQERRVGRGRPGAVGLRRSLLPGPGRRAPGHHPVGADPLAGLPRLRLDLPGARGRGQRGRRRGHPGRPPGRGRRRCGCSRPISGIWASWACSTGSPPGPGPGGWGAGSRWAWSGPCRRRAGCSWWGTRPDWSTRCRAKGSPRP